MKFFSGFVVGVALVLIVQSVFKDLPQSPEEAKTEPQLIRGMTMLPDTGECITKQQLTVFQTIRSNMALVKFGDYSFENPHLLLINSGDHPYYDDQKIKIPRGKCARRVGTYQYENMGGFTKTVPVVIID